MKDCISFKGMIQLGKIKQVKWPNAKTYSTDHSLDTQTSSYLC